MELVALDEESFPELAELDAFFPINEIDPEFGEKAVNLFLEQNKDLSRKCQGFNIHFEYQGGHLEMFVHLPGIALDRLKQCLTWLRHWQSRLEDYQGVGVYLKKIIQLHKQGHKPAVIADYLNEMLLDNLARYTVEKFISNLPKSIKKPPEWKDRPNKNIEHSLLSAHGILMASGFSFKHAKKVCEQAATCLKPRFEDKRIIMSYPPWPIRTKTHRKPRKPFQGPINSKHIRDKIRQLRC